MSDRNESSAKASHRFVSHTAEVQVELRAPTLASLFEQAGRALADLMLEEAGDEMDESVRIDLEAESREALLVDWVNELIFRSEVDKVVYTDFAVDEIDDGRLAAQISGVEVRALRTPVKAATYHDLAVEQADDHIEARLVLDV